MASEVRVGGALRLLEVVPDESVHCVVTSPPYFGLRDYDHPDQLGREPTVQQYVASLAAVFAEIRRVLRPDGVAWLNLGDTYSSGNRTRYDTDPKLPARGIKTRPLAADSGVKAKDLYGVPWRVAFALQDAGWYLRSEVIWAKPNAVPESVEDRPTRAHETVFLLARERRYFYDSVAIREPQEGDGGTAYWSKAHHDASARSGTYRRDYEPPADGMRNKRDVWAVTSQPFPGAHFAVFPPALIEPMILAGSPQQACGVCGAPWTRTVERKRTLDGEPLEGGWMGVGPHRIGANGVGHWRTGTAVETVGWRPTCACGAPDGVYPDDLELIHTPTGEDRDDDPSQQVGRAGLARPRGDDEGTRPITRYEQRAYARQLRALPVVKQLELRDQLGGEDTWAHYLRTDSAGARPLPPPALEYLISGGVLDRVEVPEWTPPETVPAVVLDPFCGSGTVGVVCGWHGRDFLGLELNEKYAELARRRIAQEGHPGRRLDPGPDPHPDQLALLS